jgi:glycosyltransferase involved in cell wall biosynthesis
MKKVLMIAPALEKGGMERQLSLFLKSFDRSSLKVTLALFRNNIAYEIPNDIEVIDLKKKGKIDFAFLIRLMKLFKNKKYDLINSKISGVNEYLMLYSRFIKLPPVVMEIRNSGEYQKPYYRKMKWLSTNSNKSWKIICNSSKALDEVKAQFPEKNVIWIKNGIDSNLFQNYGKSKKKLFKIAFVGRIDPDKNIETLLKGIGLLGDKLKSLISLEIIGNPVQQTYLESLQGLSLSLNLKEIVSFHYTKNDIWNYYNEIDMLILPSHFEGTPNVLLEAMSCELICLISKGANSDNFLSNKFVFETLDPNDLAKKINNLMELSEEEKIKIGAANRKFVVENYSLEKMTKDLTSYLTANSL